MKYLSRFESITSALRDDLRRTITQLKAENGDLTIPYEELSKDIDDCFVDMSDDSWIFGTIRNPRKIYELDRHRMKIVIHKLHRCDESINGKEYLNIINSIEKCANRYAKIHSDILEYDGIYISSDRNNMTSYYQVIDIWFSKKNPFVISEIYKNV